MKKTYIAPEAMVLNVETAGMIAESLAIDAEKFGSEALVQEDNSWDIWGSTVKD